MWPIRRPVAGWFHYHRHENVMISLSFQTCTYRLCSKVDAGWLVMLSILNVYLSSLQTMASNSTMTNMRGKTYSDFQTNLSQRLMTFYPEGGGFASLWKCPHVYPDALVRAGFIYSGHKDRVHCVFCRKNLSQWEPGDDPRLEHIKHFPDCVGIQYEWVSKGCL